ncbi:MAG: S24 family peptidase [Planctomycetaceae bacterium]
MTSNPRQAICDRLAELRELHFGHRGRARFARELGISPTTYALYEQDRVPPAELLWRAAELTGTRLEWLVAGIGPREATIASKTEPLATDLAEQLHDLLTRRPDLWPLAERMLEQLRQAERDGGGRLPDSPVLAHQRRSELIPLVGSTSAGRAHFWSELDEAGDGLLADARLEPMLQRCLDRPAEAASQVTSSDGSQVSLVQWSRPDDNGILEFLAAGAIRERYPRCVAWRIDGQSMFPVMPTGTWSSHHPMRPADDGHPCVIRQRGQLGVSCKLLRREGDDYVLIPVNEQYPVQRIPTREVEWAWRVVASVRLKGGSER